jgi:Histidine kinase-like ATPase domain
MAAVSKASSLGSAAPQGGESALRWRALFDGDESQVREVRRWLTGLLPACPARDDVVSVACELSTKAIAHTASGHDGVFAVEIAWHGATVAVAVADAGAPTGPYPIDDPMAERGRGLMLVHGLCIRTGVSGDRRGRLVWGDVLWSGPPVPLAAAGSGHEAAIRDGLAGLADRHRDVLAWFGRSTLQWWALAGQPGDPRLVTAPTPGELGDLIDSLQTPPRGRPMRAPDAAAARAGRRTRPAMFPVPPPGHSPRLRAGGLTMRPC